MEESRCCCRGSIGQVQGPSESGGGESTSQQRTDRISLHRNVVVREVAQFIGVMHLGKLSSLLLPIPLPFTLCLECWLIGGRARDISVRSIPFH
jgi:hypothetical protein